jgi:hypothetical protein
MLRDERAEGISSLYKAWLYLYVYYSNDGKVSRDIQDAINIIAERRSLLIIERENIEAS